MHLRSYLDSSPRGTGKLLAERAGTTPSRISELAADRLWPKREFWQRIVEATDGQVTPNDHLTGWKKECANGEKSPT